MLHKVCHVDFSLCQKLEMIVWFVKYWRRLQTKRFIAFLFGYQDSHLQSYWSDFRFPKCHSLQGSHCLSFGLARPPCGSDWLFSSKANWYVVRVPWAPLSPATRCTLVLLIGFFFSSFMTVRNTRRPTHPCVGLPRHSHHLSLELLFFAASKNITRWFFQVSSTSIYLNRTRHRHHQ